MKLLGKIGKITICFSAIAGYYPAMAFRIFKPLSVSLAFAFMLGLGAIANAQSDDQSTSAEVKAEVPIEELEQKLAQTVNQAKAKRLAQKIQERWMDSGSASINVLMLWSAKAFQAKDWPKTLDLLDQIIVLDPGYAEAWNRRAAVYYESKDFSRSLQDLEETLKLNPNHFGALSGLAGIFQAMERDQKALELWYKVLEIYPANETAQKSVIELEEKLAGRDT